MTDETSGTSEKPKPTAAEIAAQLLLMDSAVIHVFEKTLAAVAAYMASSREMRDALVQALADGEEIGRLRAENARLWDTVDLLWPPVVEGEGAVA